MEVIFEKRNKLNIFGNDYNTSDGTCERDYIHVTDLAKAHYLSYIKFNSINKSFIINLASGEKYSVLEVINGCKKYLNKKINYNFTDRRKGDPAALYSISKLAKIKLGLKPKYSNLDILLSSTFNVYKEVEKKCSL